nr:transposase [Desulfobacter curvatus]
MSRLKTVWENEYKEWQGRGLSWKKQVCTWADWGYCNFRMDDRQCILVIIGATEDDYKELLALEWGYRENEQSWLSFFYGLKRQGIEQDLKLAIGDGVLDFGTRFSKHIHPRNGSGTECITQLIYKNKFPKSVQLKAKADLHEIWQVPTKTDAKKAFNSIINTHEAKYPNAVKCLVKD